MGWIRVSDDFYDNDKLGDVGPLGTALYFAAMGFCNRNLTDGYFKKRKAPLFLDFDGIGITTATAALCSFAVEGDDAAKLVVEWMVAAELWHENGHDCEACHARGDGGEPASSEYLIHDYLKFQPSKAEVEAKAEANRKRVEAFREARKAAAQSGNGECNALRTPNVHASNAVGTPLVQTPQPQPQPQPQSTSSLVTYGGEVTKVDAREAPRPHCPDHEENFDVPCVKCKRRREWDEAHSAAVQADELERKRTRRAQSAEALRDCPFCDDDGWLLGDDGTPAEPAVKCIIHEPAQAVAHA